MNNVSIKPSMSTYVIFTIIWGVVITIGIIVIFSTGNFEFPVFWIGIFGLIISYLIISRYKIFIIKDRLVYRSLLKNKSILLSDIRKFKINSAVNREDPTLGLYIFSNKYTSHFFVINIKLFSKGDINLLLEVLNNSTSHGNFN